MVPADARHVVVFNRLATHEDDARVAAKITRQHLQPLLGGHKTGPYKRFFAILEFVGYYANQYVNESGIEVYTRYFTLGPDGLMIGEGVAN